MKNVDMDVWQDNALAPEKEKTKKILNDGVDAVFSTSWPECQPYENLTIFLKTYRPYLKLNGIIIFTAATHAYDKVKNSQYHSADWNLPVEKRRPSEYKLRIDSDEVNKLANDCGYKLERSATFSTLITGNPKMATYMLRRETT
ncbi:MAG: hypothetical protein LBR22_01480 [Desulfovibrio sp.]|nr:hypothetical protein [Desulfovibrio sp.]